MAGTDFAYYTYTADDGSIYSVKIQEDLGSQAKAGFGAYDVTKPLLPRGMKMRYANVEAADGNRRRIPLGATTADLYTGVSTSIDLKIVGAALAVTYNVTRVRGQSDGPTVHPIVNK